jgi:hypothetical protein
MMPLPTLFFSGGILVISAKIKDQRPKSPRPKSQDPSPYSESA